MENKLSLAKKKSYNEFIIDLVVYAYIILFIYAGFYKLLDFTFSKVSMERSPLIGPYAEILAYLIPISEISIAGLLFTPKYKLVGLYLSTLIMVAFTTYVVFLLYFSPEIPCHCGGILSQMGWEGHLFLNSGFVLAGALAIYLRSKMTR